MGNENIVYWHGRPVGIHDGQRISWFPGAPRAAIKSIGRA